MYLWILQPICVQKHKSWTISEFVQKCQSLPVQVRFSLDLSIFSQFEVWPISRIMINLYRTEFAIQLISSEVWISAVKKVTWTRRCPGNCTQTMPRHVIKIRRCIDFQIWLNPRFLRRFIRRPNCNLRSSRRHQVEGENPLAWHDGDRPSSFARRTRYSVNWRSRDCRSNPHILSDQPTAPVSWCFSEEHSGKSRCGRDLHRMVLHEIKRLFISCTLLLACGHVRGACDFDSDCLDGEVCCNYQCVTGSDCYGQLCTTDPPQCGDQTADIVCCSQTCVYGSSCVGRSCSNSSSCSLDESCTDGYCERYYHDDGDDRLAMTLIIVCSVLGCGIISCLCIICCCLRRGARHGGRVIGNRRFVQTRASYGSTPGGYQALPPQSSPHPHYCGVPPGNHPPYPPHPAGYGVQYPTTSSAPSQHPDAPPAYGDVVHAPRGVLQEGTGRLQPSAPSPDGWMNEPQRLSVLAALGHTTVIVKCYYCMTLAWHESSQCLS